MATKVEMPKLSDTMDEGVLVEWTAKEGDAVSAGDVIAQVETDKATMDLEVYDDGVLLKRVVQEGDSVPLGGLIAILGEEGEDVSGLLEQSGGEEDGTKGGEGDGDGEAEDTGGAQAEEAGDGETGRQGDEDPSEAGVETGHGRSPEKAQSGNGRIKVSPLARRLAGEHEVDLGQISGSGPEGRIIKRDIEALVGAPEKERKQKTEQRAPEPIQPAYRLPDEESEGEDAYESAKISQMRKTIARRLAQSKFTAPHFYLTVDVDAARAAALRERINASAGEEGSGSGNGETSRRISFNDLITKACAMALRRHPQVNASYLAEAGEIRYYKHVHVAVAVAVDEGLVTPVIRHADLKGIRAIGEETHEMASRAREKQLDLKEMEGSTFTTSNLGMFGIEEFTAIINPPNACLLAIGAVREAPVVEGGEIIPGKRMKLTLSCDHRIVDGATGARFLQTVQEYLEEPAAMLL